jgi:PIN domain nuclease of toxin-antitoxin system
VRLPLDTHVVLWWLADDRQLRDEARTAIAAPHNDVVVSVASIWEIEIKRAIGRLEAPDDLVGALERSGFGILPIEADAAVAAAHLPPHHTDPFDRVLIAQCQLERLTLLTQDATLSSYDVPVLSA